MKNREEAAQRRLAGTRGPRKTPLLTFAITTIPTKVAAAGVFELTVAFGADADHGGHDCTCYAG